MMEQTKVRATASTVQAIRASQSAPTAPVTFGTELIKLESPNANITKKETRKPRILLGFRYGGIAAQRLFAPL